MKITLTGSLGHISKPLADRVEYKKDIMLQLLAASPKGKKRLKLLAQSGYRHHGRR